MPGPTGGMPAAAVPPGHATPADPASPGGSASSAGSGGSASSAGSGGSASSAGSGRPAGPATLRRQFVLTLLLGAAGAGLALLAVRQGWARVVYTAPRPLPSQSVTVTGQDLAPAAGALALAGLACLAAVIATRGLARRAAGVVLALCGAGTAVAASGSLSAARVIAVAATKVSSSASVASGSAGSTTGGTSSAGGAVVTGGASAHALLLGVPWRVAVFAGAAAIIAAGAVTAWRGTRWPVMSGRYERTAQASPARAGPGRPAAPAAGTTAPAVSRAAGPATAATAVGAATVGADGRPAAADRPPIRPVPSIRPPSIRPPSIRPHCGTRSAAATTRRWVRPPGPRVVPPAEPSARHPAVLLAEHEPQVAELARRYLARAGLRVIMAATPPETVAALCERPAAPAVAVLDLTMPGLDARRLRRLLAPRETPTAAAPTPAIYLLGGSMRPRDARASADHCLHRPFSPRFLVARVLSALPSPPPTPAMSLHDRRGFPAESASEPSGAENPRRSSRLRRTAAPLVRAPEKPTAWPPGLALDPVTRRVRTGGRDITLTPSEFALLSALAAHAGRVLTRDQLQAAMRRPSSGRAVDVHVAQLRAKLPVPGPIRTVRGVGYILDEPCAAPGRLWDG